MPACGGVVVYCTLYSILVLVHVGLYYRVANAKARLFSSFDIEQGETRGKTLKRV